MKRPALTLPASLRALQPPEVLRALDGARAPARPRRVAATPLVTSTHVEAIRSCQNALGTLAHAEEMALPRPILVVVLDAPDHILNARMNARGESVTLEDAARRAVYREGAGEARLWAWEGSVIRTPAPPLVVVDSSGPVEETAKRVATEVLRAMGRPVVGWDGDGREVSCVG